MKKAGLKKGIGMVMATAMAMGMMVMPVSAEGNDSLNVGYSAGTTTYTLSIPTSITLSDTEPKQTTEIGLSAVNTIPAEKVQVKIIEGITTDGNVGKVELTRMINATESDPNTKVVSTVTGKDNVAVSNGFVVAEFEGTSTNPTPIETSNGGVLNFSAISNSGSGAVKAGSYLGTIVFEAKAVTK